MRETVPTPSPPRQDPQAKCRLRIRRWVWVLWICFMMRGLFYCTLLPMWEGYDEPFHFSYLQYVVAHGKLPRSTEAVSREVEASFHLVPLSWEQRLQHPAPPIYTEEQYWQLPPQQRAAMQTRLNEIPREWAGQPAQGPLDYEAQQAPLYYALLSLPLRWAWGWNLPARVFLIRMLSIALASLVVPLAYLAGKRFFDDKALAISAVAVMVCLPELFIDLARVANDGPAIVLYALLMLLMLQAFGSPPAARFLPLVGMVLGLGLLTKAYFVAAIPAFVLLMALAVWRWPAARKQVVAQSAAAIGVLLVISGAWYWRAYALTGTLTGEENEAAAAHVGAWGHLAAAAHADWHSGIASILISHIWFGAWSFLKLRKSLYIVFGAGLLAAGLGVMAAMRTARGTRGFEAFQKIAVVGGLYGFFWLALAYNVLVVYMATGVSASDGWYLYAVVAPEVLLAILGLRALVGARFKPFVPLVIAVAFVCIDLYGVHALLMPYYTGFIGHVRGADVIHAAGLQQLAEIPKRVLLQRLTANWPTFIGSLTMGLLWVGYLVATVIALLLCGFAGREMRGGQCTGQSAGRGSTA